MATLKAGDRVRETSVTTGTGDIALAGAVTNFRAFGAVFVDTDLCWVTFVKGSDFETSLCTFNSGANSLTRVLVFESSNGGALVNFGAGTMDVINTFPSQVAVGIGPISTFNFRLCPATGVPIQNTAVSAATAIFCTPYHGNQRARYTGAIWRVAPAVEDSLKVTDTQTGNTSSSSPNITNLADTSKIPIGYKLSGTGMPANAVVGAVPSSSSVTIYVSGSPTNATATNASVSITFKAPANTGYDVYDDMTNPALKLQAVVRSAIHTDPTYGSQDGVPTHPSTLTLRHIGKFQTGNTDGQIDYEVIGKYRFTIWNRYNRLYREHCESFAASGTWWKSLCTTRVKSDIAGGSGNGAAALNGGTNVVMGGCGGRGGRDVLMIYAADLLASETVTVGGVAGTSSFGSHHSATGGTSGGTASNSPSLVVGTNGTDGAGSSGNADYTGVGPAGGLPAAIGVDTAGQVATGTAQVGRSGWAIVDEIVEV